MKVKKAFTTSLSTFLILGILTTVGFLSFTGMLLISPYLALAAASFFFAVVIEGEVYKQNIMEGVKKLFTRNYLKKKLVERELNRHLHNPAALEHSEFLRDYKAQFAYVEDLKAAHANPELIQKESKRLKIMFKFFSKFLYSKIPPAAGGLTDDLSDIISPENRIELQKELFQKRWLNRAMSIFYLLAGVSCTFASIYSIHAGCLTLMTAWGVTLAPTILMGGVIPLAIMAGIGYSILMYHNVSDMINNDTVQKAVKKIKKFFQPKPDENKLYFAFKVAAIGFTVFVVIGLCVFATVATAGTWWVAAKQGARLIPHLARAANWIRNITIPGMSVPTLLFNLKNSFDTLKKLDNFSLTRNLKNTFAEIVETKAAESWVEFLNPFRMLIKVIELPIQLCTFLLHLVSVGVMSDRLFSVPPAASTPCNIANELLVDAHYFMEDSNHSHHGHHHDHSHSHGHHHDHGHHHGTIVNKLLFIILSPFYFLSDLWAWGFSKKETPSFLTVFKQRFGLEPKTLPELPMAPAISNAWKHQEILIKLNKKMPAVATNESTQDPAPPHSSRTEKITEPLLNVETLTRKKFLTVEERVVSDDKKSSDSAHPFFKQRCAPITTRPMYKRDNSVLVF